MSTYPPPQAHDPIEEIFENVFWVHGSMRMGPGFRLSRNMVVLRQADELTLVGLLLASAYGYALLLSLLCLSQPERMALNVQGLLLLSLLILGWIGVWATWRTLRERTAQPCGAHGEGQESPACEGTESPESPES